jgi:cytochrome c553
MMSTPRFPALGVLALAGIVSLSACAANGSNADAIELSPVAAEGRSIANSNGCGACHGTDGQGSVGPPFVGLYGSTVQLDDGTTVTADRDYLIESIKDPAAKKTDGFRIPMPTNRLTDDEIDKVVAYIEELAGPSERTTP